MRRTDLCRTGAQGLIGAERHRGVCISPPIVKLRVGVWQVPPQDLIAVICIFHGANRSRMALYLDENGVEPSFSFSMPEEVVSDPAHELVRALRSSLAFMSTGTVD
jgi:hypothetical protein